MRMKMMWVSGSVLAMATAMPVAAQEADVAGQPVAEVDAGTSDKDSGSDIVVTGSRISRRDYVSPSPIATASEEAIQATGAVNIEAALNQLPQFAPGQGAGDGQTLGGGGRATLNLRGLGEQRNLVLLDGRRLPISNARGVVDVNIIPTAIVQGVEVISGGASAVYGSDAISGVANFKTRPHFEGLVIDAQYGNAFKGDAYSFSGSITGGGEFADGRGSAVFSAAYSKREELRGDRREFFRTAAGGSSSTGIGVVSFLAGNAPSQAAINTVFARYGIAPGTVRTTTGIGFNENGTIFAANGGANFLAPNSEYVLLNGVLSQVVAPHNTIVVPQERYNLFGKLSYEILPEVTLYAQGLYSHTEQKMAQGFPLSVPTRPSVPASNPFIPSDLKDLLNSRANPNAPFLLNRRFMETGPRYYEEPFDTFQVLAGAKGGFGGGWTWDIYASHDETRNAETLTNGVSITRLQTLLNAPDGGRSICAGGYNPFGLSNALATSQACIDYISLELHNITKVSQDIVEASTQGALFRLPAGEVKIALSANYRKNKYSFSPDSLQVATAALPFGDIFASVPTSATRGATDVKELAGELFVPLLADQPFARSLNLSLGYRYSDYKYSGGVSTYKAEMDWRIAEPLLLRGSYEHAIRAPNIEELFLAPSGSLAQLGFPPTAGDPCDFRFTPRGGPNGAQIRALCVAQGVPSATVDSFTFGNGQVVATLLGNRDLDPEKANTFTVGAVLSPKLSSPVFSALSLSVDYYNIDISKVISAIPGINVVNKCFNLDGSNPSYAADNYFCSLLSRNTATGEIAQLRTPFLNLGGYKTSGIDIQLDWRMDLEGMGIAPGRLTFNSFVNYLSEFKIQTLPGSPFQEFAGTIGSPPLPKWKALTTLSYGVGDFELGFRWRFVDAMRDATAVTQPASPLPGVKSYSLFDMFARADISETFELRGGITNLANKRPLDVGGRRGVTNANLYDVIGRSFYLAVRAKF